MTRIMALLIVAVVFVSIQTYGQKKDEPGDGTIIGKISDSAEHTPLEYATVTLYAKGNSKPIDGTTTNTSGHFQLINVPQGSYTLVAESIGYQPVTIHNITVNDKISVADLKTIALAKKISSLQAVVVTAQGKTIDEKIDKMVFNAEKDVTSQTGVATDVLKKIPQVSVDVDGNVELAGSSSIRFLINGKPSTAFGSSITDVLQTIPASQIKSVEVITNPGAKYDAQGLGGIINIILKKNNARGINGNLSLSPGTRMDNGSFNFNARKGKLALNTFISGNTRPYVDQPSASLRISIDSTDKIVQLQQDGSSRFQRHGYQTGAGFDYTINDKNSITGSVSYNNFGNTGSGYVNQSQQTIQQNTGSTLSTLLSLNNTNNEMHAHSTDAALSYIKKFSKEDQELSIEMNTSFEKYRGTSGNMQYYMPQDSLYYGTNSTNPSTQNENEVKVDYTQPLKENVSLGMGSKFTSLDISSNSDVLVYKPYQKLFMQDAYLTNSLNYHQKVYALYSEINFPVGKLLEAKLGGRYERTDINSFYSNAQQQVKTPGYNTFVPSVFLMKKLGEHTRLKLNYSKRIERPDFRDLNPFINTSDPKNFTAGNPYLQPEIGNRIELNVSKDIGKAGSLTLNIFYRTSDHDIQPYIFYYPTLKVGDSVYTNVALSQRQNIGLEKDAGANLFWELHFINKFNIRGNFFAFKRHTLNAIDAGYNARSVNFRSNINANYQFSNTLVAEFFGNFQSARHQVQGTYPSFTTYSFAVRKQFWNKNGSIAFTTVNPFNEFVNQQTTLSGPNFNVTSLRKVPFRSFGINFTWKFGKLEFKKEKDKEDNSNLNVPEQQQN